MTPDEAAVLAVLRCTHHRSHKQERIATEADMPLRLVQEAIQGLRLKGYAILGDNNGMTLVETREDALRAYRSLRSRALTQMMTARQVLRAALAKSERPDVYRVEEAPELWP